MNLHSYVYGSTISTCKEGALYVYSQERNSKEQEISFCCCDRGIYYLNSYIATLAVFFTP